MGARLCHHQGRSEQAGFIQAALAEAYQDDKADIAIGTSSSAAALADLPVAEENKKILIVEPAVATRLRREVESIHLPHRP